MDIRLQIHRVSGAPYGADIPTLKDRLTALYKTCGIQLHFDPGQTLPSGLSSKTQFLDAIHTRAGGFPRQPPAAAHLILASRGHVNDFANGIGALVDTEHRGVAAVFCNVAPLDSGVATAILLQVCAHEIGHMFNLGHECLVPSPGQVPTAMCQAKHRPPPKLAQAWVDLGLVQPPGLPAFPFSQTSRSQLLDGNPSRPPWGGSFTKLGSLTELDSFELAIEPDQDYGVTGESFGFDVVLTNRARSRQRVPTYLSIERGMLSLLVTRPDGTTYLHRPTVRACDLREQMLPPQGQSFHPQVLLRGPGCQIFPIPGRYRFELAIGARLATAIEINVRTRRGGTPSRSFSRFLSVTPFRHDPRQAKAMNAELRSGDIKKDPFVAHLAYLKARRLVAPGLVEELLDEASRSTAAPRAVRHAAWLDRCWRARTSASRLAELRSQAEDLFTDDRRDRVLHDQIQKMLTQARRRRP